MQHTRTRRHSQTVVENQTRFADVRALRAAGAAVVILSARAADAAPPIFPPDNPWNQKITNALPASNSGAVMTRVIGLSGDGRLHPDFWQNYADSSSLYGIPYNVVNSSTPKVSVVLGAYANQSDPLPCPIPANAVLEGDKQDGPTVGLNARGDSHLIVWDQQANILCEFYRASRPNENGDGNWHADSESVWDLNANSFRPLGWTSADAAGLPILAGLARPDEGLPIALGGQGIIRHAIRFTLTNSVILNKFIFPASHVANPGNTDAGTQPPMGARFRLKAGVNISNLYPQSMVIAQAMKDYGLILADNGSNFYFTGASSSAIVGNSNAATWSDDDIQSTTRGLKSLHFSDFEMVDLTPVVSSLSAASGAPGATITITGVNFSGAAGYSQVLFGPTPSPSIVTLDESHISAVVPTGTGMVDVRVRLGSTINNSQNLKNPIFGAGISAITPACSFTFGAACPSDLNGDSVVDDADFVLFASAYDLLDCSDGSMPPGCPADMNRDGFVDDSDFTLFATAYDVLVCP
ncbi:MAG: IPT/TIG domain-containing protein [Phycisphaerales bacterium]